VKPFRCVQIGQGSESATLENLPWVPLISKRVQLRVRFDNHDSCSCQWKWASECELEIRISCRMMEMCWREARFSCFVPVPKECCGERETRNGSELGSSNQLNICSWVEASTRQQGHVEAVLKIGEDHRVRSIPVR
jgi:hypothetical protein